MPITVTSTATIAVPAAAAWTFLSVYANDPEWRTGVSRMEQTPSRPVIDGARVIEDLRLLGQDFSSVVEVFDVVPGESFRWRVIDGATAYGRRVVRPIDDRSCEVIAEKTLELRGAQRLLTPIVARTVRRNEDDDVWCAASLIEARGVN